MFAFAPEVSKMLYATNAVKNVNRSLRKIIKMRGHVPHDRAATKLLVLVLRNIESNWKNPSPGWPAALNQLDILFGERLWR